VKVQYLIKKGWYNMTLRNVIEKLSDWVNIKVIVSEYGNVIVTYDDANHINDYLDCNVEIIDTSEDGTLIVTVDDSEE
jgi:hypothetical protein